MNKLYSLFLIIFTAILLWGCSSSIETINMTPEERLAYAIQLYNDEDYELAVNEFSSIILQYPGHTVVDDAQYYLGMSRFQRTEYIMSAYEFSRLIKNMPASEFVSQAQYMLAESYYYLSPDYSLDQQYSRKAIEEYQAFIDFFPTNEKVAEAEKKIKELNEKLAQKNYNTAYIYERMEYYTAALIYYNNVVELYHDTDFAPLALYNRINILISRNRNNEALAETRKFLERYPGNIRTGEVEQIKASLENKLSAAK